jgi:hypothetical protein
MFNYNPFTQKFSPVELIHSIFSVSAFVKLDKSEAIFQIDISNTTKTSEESFHIFLSGVIRQPTDINTIITRHPAPSGTNEQSIKATKRAS